MLVIFTQVKILRGGEFDEPRLASQAPSQHWQHLISSILDDRQQERENSTLWRALISVRTSISTGLLKSNVHPQVVHIAPLQFSVGTS